MSNKIILEKLRRNLNTDLLIFIKCKFLRILNSSQSSKNKWWRSQDAITLSEKEKKTLDIAVLGFFQYLPLDNLFHFDHDQVHDEVNMCTS